MLPLVVQVEKTADQTADTVAFARSPVRIGRNPLNDLQLDEPFVSQWHAVIRFNQGKTSYLDLGSTNRTLINGRAIERNHEVVIDHDTDIRIGPLRLHTLRAPAPPELFGRRRRSAFGQPAESAEAGAEPKTMLLSFDSPPGTEAGDRALAQLNAIRAGLSTLDANRGARPSQTHASFPPPSSAPPPLRPSRPAPAAASHEDPLAKEYAAYRERWGRFFDSVRRHLDGLPPARRAAEVASLRERFPALGTDAEFGRYLTGHGIASGQAIAQPRATSSMPDMESWLSRLTGGLFERDPTRMNASAAMERVGAILEIFGQAFLEMRRSQEQFCVEMSLERYPDDSMLHRTDDLHALLAYLLTAPKDQNARLNELSRALADFALHQVGIVSAIVEGGRKLVNILSPASLADTQDPPVDSPALTHHRALAKLWPRSARKLWHRYLAHHYDLEESDRFMQELFGREFARRYYAVTGGSSSGT